MTIGRKIERISSVYCEIKNCTLMVMVDLFDRRVAMKQGNGRRRSLRC